MTKKRGKFMKKGISLLLVLVMVISLAPLCEIIASSATVDGTSTVGSNAPTVYSQLGDGAAYNYPGGSGSTYCTSGCGVYALVNAVKALTGKKIDPHKLGNLAIKCGARVDGGTNGPKLYQKAASDPNFGGTYGFKIAELYRYGSSKRWMRCNIGKKRYSENYPSESEWKTVYSKLVSHLQQGHVAVVQVLGHYMAIIDYDAKSDKFLMLDSGETTTRRLTANKGKWQWVTPDQLNYNKAKKANSSYTNQAPYIHLRESITFLSKTGTTNYEFNSQNDTPSKRTETTNEITGITNKSIKYSSWGYYYGTEKDKAKVKAHTSASVTVAPKNKNNESKKTFSTTVKGLKPDNTYWYVIWVKPSSGGTIYSNAFWGSTPKQKPDATMVYVTNFKTDIGIGDAFSVNWKAASRATSYRIDVYNSSNTLVHWEDNIKGTTAAIPANKISQPDTYGVTLTAMNASGSTPCGSAAQVTVHDNVTVVFFDTVANKPISTVPDVKYGGSVTAPPNPSQPGHTFIGWDKDLSSVKENLTVNTRYEENKYTVKFFDYFTGNQIGGTQTVKYGNSATAPDVTVPSGYEFVGWDCDFTNITADLNVTSNYVWSDPDNPLSTQIVSVVPDVDEDRRNGYAVTAKITNNKNETVKGRLVFALHTEEGLLYTKTESSAFSIAGTKVGETP